MSIPHTLLSSVPPPQPEKPRKASCWHILTVALTVFSMAFASILMMKSLSHLLHLDHILEECTSNWNSHFSCHYLLLWLKLHGKESVYDTRVFLEFFCVFVSVACLAFLVSILEFYSFILSVFQDTTVKINTSQKIIFVHYLGNSYVSGDQASK